jgi:hypothetical protein
MTRTTPDETGSWSADVAGFAAEHGVEQLLSPLLEMTRRLLPTAGTLEIRLDEDPEIADFRSIVFAVRVAGLTVSQAVAVQHRWCEEMLQIYLYPRSCPFVLELDSVE